MRKNQSVWGGGGGIRPWGREKGKGREDFPSVPTVGAPDLKLVHATRATRVYQNPKFSSKLKEEGVFSCTGSSLFKSH